MHSKTQLLLPAALTMIGLAMTGLALSDDDHDGRDEEHAEYNGWFGPPEDVAPVQDQRYADECGACHMAYQPGLLPAAAWQRVMEPDALTAHYGDDAWLPEADRLAIAEYLNLNAADQARRPRSRAFSVGSERGTKGAGGQSLPRITETRYFRNEHHEVPRRLIGADAPVRSFSHCGTCHRDAERGSYDEDGIRIPGYGRWDD
jgi:hypothetical protein